MPAQIGKLTSLKELTLRSNALKELPEELGFLINLRKLDISNNALEKLPKEIKGLANLEIILAGENVIASLPEEMGALKKLMILDLDYDIEYYITLPNREKEKIAVDFLENSLVIPGEYLKETGKYSLNIHIIDRGFNTLGSSLEGQKGSIYKVEFIVDEVVAMPIKNTNKYLLISTEAVAAGLLILITARLIRRKN